MKFALLGVFAALFAFSAHSSDPTTVEAVPGTCFFIQLQSLLIKTKLNPKLYLQLQPKLRMLWKSLLKVLKLLKNLLNKKVKLKNAPTASLQHAHANRMVKNLLLKRNTHTNNTKLIKSQLNQPQLQLQLLHQKLKKKWSQRSNKKNLKHPKRLKHQQKLKQNHNLKRQKPKLKKNHNIKVNKLLKRNNKQSQLNKHLNKLLNKPLRRMMVNQKQTINQVNHKAAKAKKLPKNNCDR